MVSLYFSNRKQYYISKKISAGLKKYWANVKATGTSENKTIQEVRKDFREVKEQVKKKIIKKHNIYFVNFDIVEGRNGGVYYIRGALTSPKKFKISVAKDIIKKHLPSGYTAVNHYEAQEEGTQDKVILTMYREEEEYFNEVLYV